MVIINGDEIPEGTRETQRSSPTPQKVTEADVEVVGGGGYRKKYNTALRTLWPYRSESKRSNLLPSGHAGLISFLTFSWLTPLMWKAVRVGLTPLDLWDLHEADKAEKNAKRLNRLWQDEKSRMGPEKASFMKTVWRFGRTRFYITLFLVVVTTIFQFFGPSWVLKAVLSYQEDLSQTIEIGLALTLLSFVTQLIRNLTFSATLALGIHTGMRIEGALQYMTYEKMLRLRNGGDAILSKAITFCTNDQERIFECVATGVLLVAAPVMFLLCLVYTCFLLGPWALLGNLVIFLFYPVMGAIARNTVQLRVKAVKYTNKRVGLMNEIINSIRLIKMYGWEESFLKKVSEIRKGEEEMLRKAAFLQSVSTTITPMVNVFAAIVVFLAYTFNGNNVTAAEVFTLFSVFSAMTFTFGTLPAALRSISEAAVCLRNFQNFLELPEFVPVSQQDVQCDHNAVIAIQDGSFAWEIDSSADNPANSPKKTPSAKKNKKKKLLAKRSSTTNGPNHPTEEQHLNTINEEEPQPENFLKGINIEIKRGNLVGVSGSVGSGKTALISAILGDMLKTSGKILIRGSLAIVTQQGWIYSDSLQENILFGSPMNKEKYDHVLDICCLKADISMLSNGDGTLIGEKGVNLSGGQKQRVNLARAIYADKSIYLMDDPLSAVDSVIAKEIFEKCIKTQLREKTVVLVTSGVQFLEKCDCIAFMKDGEIVELGSHEELLANKSHYYTMLKYHQQEDTSKDEVLVPFQSGPTCSPTKPKKSSVPKETFSQKIIQDDSAYNFAGIQSYLLYFKAAGGYFMFLIVIAVFLAFSISNQLFQVWLRIWVDAGDGKIEERRMNASLINTRNDLMNTTSSIEEEIESNQTFKVESFFPGYVIDNPDLWFYQTILIAIVLGSLLIGIIKGFMSSRFVLRGASCLHNGMLTKVVRSPMRFFDITPLGKITNRFSKDMDELDARLPFFSEFVIQSMLYLLLSLIIICVVYPLFSIGIILVVAFLVLLDIWLNIGVRETKKLENVLKTPVIHHLQSSLYGLSIIRAFHREDPFKARFAVYLNQHIVAVSVYRTANRWFTFRMVSVGMLTIVAVILIAVIYRGVVTPALVGLAISSIYGVCTFIPFAMRMKSELQARFLSVERILEYSEELVEEEPEEKVVIKPKEDWPTNPEIKFESVSMRYDSTLPFVIKDLSLDIRAGEKIGVVGRTGAGKTSIIATLLRLYPLEHGKVTISGMDINEISIKDVRRSIAVIPQDPVMFQGTLRYNLDPFNQHSDEDLWSALDKSHMKAKIEKEEKKLAISVSSDGDNFSVGEKQLICLSRALLRKNKILLLDEATASLDIETDFLIQKTIREAFESSTVVTIAHRLNTVAFYDRIVVMEKGEMIELDTPENLMNNTTSRFHRMMIASGISSLEQLKSRSRSVSED